MGIKSQIAENYFKKEEDPGLDDFLNYSCEQMFLSYILKTLKETKKQYVINKNRQKNSEIELFELCEYAEYSQNDNYNCFFDELINDLPEKQKQIIILCFKFGYKDNVAAKIIGVSPQAAYGLKQRALNTIRKKFF